jgi:amidase
MPVSELWIRTANELARLIAGREVSSREVIDAHLARIEAVNPCLNAVVRVMADEARQAADAADRAVAAGDPLGPLHGVPFTVKENIDVAGTPTTQGIAVLAEAVADRDAPVVARMRAAGAIPIGRTNLPDLGLRVHTDSQLHGRTRNPWDHTRTAGGSSGGEGSALASGMSPIGLGNDIGGSLRNPAHCCGISAIKPTTGVVPHATVVPPVDWGISQQMMLVEGVMARQPSDVRTGFMAVAGQHLRDPLSVPARLVDLEPGRTLTIGVLAEPPGGSTHPGIAAVVRSAGTALASLGHRVEEAVPPGYERVLRLWQRLLTVDLSVQQELLDLVLGDDGRTFAHFGQEIIGPVPHVEAMLEFAERQSHQRAWAEWFERFDILICPVWTQPAFPAGFDIESVLTARAVFELMRPVLPANYLGTPSAVVPAGFADGLPVGVQVMGAAFTDLRCLAVAEQIAGLLTPTTPIDPRGFPAEGA